MPCVYIVHTCKWSTYNLYKMPRCKQCSGIWRWNTRAHTDKQRTIHKTKIPGTKSQQNPMNLDPCPGSTQTVYSRSLSHPLTLKPLILQVLRCHLQAAAFCAKPCKTSKTSWGPQQNKPRSRSQKVEALLPSNPESAKTRKLSYIVYFRV